MDHPAAIAVFAVHTFRSREGTLPANLERNASDMLDFLRAFDTEDSPATAFVEIQALEALNWEHPSSVVVGSTHTDPPALV